MNDINIFRELEDLRYRKNISQRKIAILCDVKPQSAQEWFTKNFVDDKYLWIIANAVGDDAFVLALICYELRLPNHYLRSLLNSKDDSYSMIVSAMKEDSESDAAIPLLMNQLSQLKPDENLVGSMSLEILDTGLKYILAAMNVFRTQNISIPQAILERS